jgi:hypothetical protein
MRRAARSFGHRTVDELVIGDEASLRHVALYSELKDVLRRSAYEFRVLPPSAAARADRALFLNLTFWTATAGGDILVDERIEADVVAHAAWHHLAARALATAPGEPPSVDALFLGEAIASAFDVYLVGRLLGHAPRSSFLETQVPAMAEAAHAAGLSAHRFEQLLASIARDPDRAFADLRELLSDATSAIYECRTGEEALSALATFDRHRFGALLHRYELSNWVLYARAYGDSRGSRDRRDRVRARAVDRALRKQKAPLDWLAARWIEPSVPSTTPRSKRGAAGPGPLERGRTWQK